MNDIEAITKERDIYKGVADRNYLRITCLEAELASTKAEYLERMVRCRKKIEALRAELKADGI